MISILPYITSEGLFSSSPNLPKTILAFLMRQRVDKADLFNLLLQRYASVAYIKRGRSSTALHIRQDRRQPGVRKFSGETKRVLHTVVSNHSSEKDNKFPSQMPLRFNPHSSRARLHPRLRPRSHRNQTCSATRTFCQLSHPNPLFWEVSGMRCRLGYHTPCSESSAHQSEHQHLRYSAVREPIWGFNIINKTRTDILLKLQSATRQERNSQPKTRDADATTKSKCCL